MGRNLDSSGNDQSASSPTSNLSVSNGPSTCSILSNQQRLAGQQCLWLAHVRTGDRFLCEVDLLLEHSSRVRKLVSVDQAAIHVENVRGIVVRYLHKLVASVSFGFDSLFRSWKDKENDQRHSEKTKG